MTSAVDGLLFLYNRCDHAGTSNQGSVLILHYVASFNKIKGITEVGRAQSETEGEDEVAGH